MRSLFQELDNRPTPIGRLSLRRRRDLRLDQEVYEIKLDEEYLMSSLVTASEIALAQLGLAELGHGAHDVVVGGLGLGYTAQAVLQQATVRSLLVVELLDPVVDWHESGLLPLGPGLTADPRCRFVRGDFFALAAAPEGFDPQAPGRRFDAILVDIDHSPERLLDERSAAFYSPGGLRRLAGQLRPGGVFGLWSDDRPDAAFTRRLQGVFAAAEARPVTFHNPLLNQPFTQTVYLARA